MNSTKLFNLLLHNIAQVEPIEKAIEANVAAKTAAGHLAATRQLLDALEPIAKDYDEAQDSAPLDPTVAASFSQQDAEGQFKAKLVDAGFDGSRIQKIMDLIIKYGPTIINLLGGLHKGA